MPKRRDPILPGNPGPMSSLRTQQPTGFQQPRQPAPPPPQAPQPQPQPQQQPSPPPAPSYDFSNLDTGPRPVTPAGPPPGSNGPGAPQAPAQPLDPSSGGTTQSGLARRVRGAQLPMTQPLSLRRSSEHAGSANRDYGRDDHGAASGNGDALSGDSGDGDSGPAKDVYGFLSSFTAGVQRGLDEARRDATTPEDES
jgi:hypothetical protein